jgi:hypothetical protein
MGNAKRKEASFNTPNGKLKVGIDEEQDDRVQIWAKIERDLTDTEKKRNKEEALSLRDKLRESLKDKEQAKKAAAIISMMMDIGKKS